MSRRVRSPETGVLSATIRGAGQLVLDFDGVLCDSAAECLRICWFAMTGKSVAAFSSAEAVPTDVAARYWHTRPFMRHLAHFVVPLLDGPAPHDRAAFAERFDGLPEGFADAFAAKARAYRTAVRDRQRAAWLDLHGVWSQVADLIPGAYLATARDRDSVVEILGAHGFRPDPARIYEELSEKTSTLATIAVRESLAHADVWLLDDSIDNCLAARDAGFDAGWASWGCGDPGDEAIARANQIPVVTLDDVAELSSRYGVGATS